MRSVACNREFESARHLAVVWIAGALACALAFARSATDLSVSTTSEGGTFEVTARAVVYAPADLIWQTLTDYDHLADFVPGMNSSHVVLRQGARLVVEQKGAIGWWFFSYPIHVTVAATERPYQAIDVHLLQGNLRRLDGGYRIEPRPDGSAEVVWQGVVEPDTQLPGFIQKALLHRSISEQFTGILREIERRADLWSQRSALSH